MGKPIMLVRGGKAVLINGRVPLDSEVEEFLFVPTELTVDGSFKYARQFSGPTESLTLVPVLEFQRAAADQFPELTDLIYGALSELHCSVVP